MSWIKTISYGEATGRLQKLYDRVKGPDNNIDNILKAHSLRPHTLEGHMALYKYVLHHTGNKTEKWFLEAVGTYVSLLHNCGYCYDHHFAGMRRLLGDDDLADSIKATFQNNNEPEQGGDQVFSDKQRALLAYAEKLTRDPSAVSEHDIDHLRQCGCDDGEVLEINQVTSYFNYANRTVLGLGVNTEGDILGLSPNNSENADDWNHS